MPVAQRLKVCASAGGGAVCVYTQVLVYADLSMFAMSVALASGRRLARSQVLVMNNGVTSGLAASMDWYLSSYEEQPPNVAQSATTCGVQHAQRCDIAADGAPTTIACVPRRQCRMLQRAANRVALHVAGATVAGVAGPDRSSAADWYSEGLYMFPHALSLSYVVVRASIHSPVMRRNG